jgi:predicted nucleic acid-binding protein
VEAQLRDETQPSRISSVNAAEVVDVTTRIYQRPVEATLNALSLLEAGGLLVSDVNAAIGLAAGQLHARHYHRRASPLSMADCVALALAVSLGEALATSDPPLAAAAQAEGVAVVPLPDSAGRRPGT